jgi:hypothetical protein
MHPYLPPSTSLRHWLSPHISQTWIFRLGNEKNLWFCFPCFSQPKRNHRNDIPEWLPDIWFFSVIFCFAWYFKWDDCQTSLFFPLFFPLVSQARNQRYDCQTGSCLAFQYTGYLLFWILFLCWKIREIARHTAANIRKNIFSSTLVFFLHLCLRGAKSETWVLDRELSRFEMLLFGLEFVLFSSLVCTFTWVG